MFSRRWLVIYGLIALTGLLLFIGNSFDAGTGQPPQHRVTDLEAAAIDSIEIRTADESLLVRRTSGAWQIESPIRWPANSNNVKRLLGITRAETESRFSADEIDLDAFGLQTPKATLRLNDTRILFGTTNNIGERRYTLIDSTVFLLPDIYLPFISQGLLGIVDRRLLPPAAGLKSLKLPGFEITRSTDGAWQATGSAKYSAQQLDHLVGNWQGLEASRVKAYNAAATPREAIFALLDDGSSFDYLLISIEPELVIAHPEIGLQYHFNNDLYYQLIALSDHENTN